MIEEEIIIKVEKRAIASIDATRCTNCGKCMDYCPVDAITEKQKEICHVCPDCTEMKAITVNDMHSLQHDACTLACPLGISPQGYINLIKAGKEEEAFELIWDKNPLPTVCGFVCHHPCEEKCKRGILVDGPMEIRAIKRYLGEKFIDYQPAPYPVFNEETIAVIGAGPAGLTAAHWLSKKGYEVTVFEQCREAGGMLLRGIPQFRLDKALVREEIERLEKAGIKIIYNSKAGRNSIDKLLEDFDRVVVATGTQIPKTLPIEGWRTEQVIYAINLMEKVNAGQNVKLYGNVVVIGGGSVAMDTARTALRLGADKVTVMCLESGDEIPAHPWELEEAKEEGIEVIEGAAPQRFAGQTSKLEAVEYVKIENLKLEDGISYDIIKGSETRLPADFCIIAIGNTSGIKSLDNDRVVFAGDIASDKCSVIDAMASGREAAIKLDNELRDREYAEYDIHETVEPGDQKYKIYPAVRKKLDFPEVKRQCADIRKNNFDLAEKGLTSNEVLLETYRCLECGYKEVDTKLCIGCGVCQKICPKGDVITMIAVSENQEVK